MEPGITGREALVALFDWLYDEYRDDLPNSLRMFLNLVRKAAARATGAHVRALQTATKSDIEEAWQQSKLATGYAAVSAIRIDSVAQALDAFLRNELPAIAELLERIESKIDARNVLDADAEVSRRIEIAQDHRRALRLADARAHLEIARRELWGQVSGHNRYRILAELGICEDIEGYHDAAAALYLEAKQHDPDNPKARSFEASAYEYFGQRDKAHRIVDDIISANPAQDLAAQVWVRTAPDTLTCDNIEKTLVDSIRRNAGVQCELAKRALRNNDRKGSVRYIKTALSQAPDDIDVLAIAAQVLFEVEASEDRYIRASKPLADLQGLLSDARKHVTDALERLGPQGPPRRVADLRYNRALVCSSLGDVDQERRDLEQVLELVPQHELSRVRYWQYLMLRDEFDRAVEVANPETIADASAKLQYLYAVALRMRQSDGDREACLRVLKQLHSSRTPPLEQANIEVIDQLVGACCEKHDFDEAQGILDDVRNELPHGMYDLLCGAMHSVRGEPEQAKAAALRAAGQIDVNADISLTHRLAFLLKNVKCDKEAFPYWSALSPPDCVGPLTYELLACAYRCRKYDFICDFCSSLRDNGYIDFQCMQCELQVFEDRGVLSQTIERIQEVLEKEDDPEKAASLRLWLSVAGVRMGRDDLITDDPSLLPQAVSIDARMGRLVVEILRRRGKSEAALNYAYQMLRRHPNQEHAHVALISLIFLERKGSSFQPTVVDTRTAVCIKHSEDDRTEWYIVEDESDLPADPYRNEISAKSDLATTLKGCKIGDIVELGGRSDRTVQVVAIDDKRMRRAYECLQNFEHRFPTSGFIRRINVKRDASDKIDFSEMITVLAAHDEHANRVMDVYRDNPSCSLYFAAKSAGDSLPAHIERIAQDRGRMRCCQATDDEKMRAVAALRSAASIVLDPSALLTVYLCGSLSLLESMSRPTRVAEATHVWLRELHDDLFGEQSSNLRVSLNAGQLVAHQWSEEEASRASKKLRSFIEWSDKRLESGLSLAQLDPEYQEIMTKMFGNAAAQSIALCSQRGYALWTDDYTTGAYSHREFRVQRVWTQIVGEHEIEAGRYELAQYYELCLTMLGYQYWFVWLNLDIMIYAFKKAGHDPDRWPANVVMEAIGDKDTVLPNVVDIFKYLIDVYRIDKGTEALIRRFLQKMRSRPGGDMLLRQFRQDLAGLCGLDVATQFHVQSLIDSILAAHESKIILPSGIDLLRFGRTW